MDYIKFHYQINHCNNKKSGRHDDLSAMWEAPDLYSNVISVFPKFPTSFTMPFPPIHLKL